MTHPTNPVERAVAGLTGVTIAQRDAGTVIVDPETGDELTVSDGISITLGRAIYMTPRDYEALKAHLEEKGL